MRCKGSRAHGCFCPKRFGRLFKHVPDDVAIQTCQNSPQPEPGVFSDRSRQSPRRKGLQAASNARLLPAGLSVISMSSRKLISGGWPAAPDARHQLGGSTEIYAVSAEASVSRRLEDVSEKAPSFGQGKSACDVSFPPFRGAGEVVAFAALMVSGVS